ncbi:MAG TPA: hypothetical protein VN607_08535 [Gemmatimonadaceae bacterium]|nr:hypothetical protein [Gemmatimonadaceae bacterium]
MFIETRALGKKARSLDRWSIPVPPATGDGDDGAFTLRTLITRVVLNEVAAFDERQRQRRLMRVLSQTEIADGAAAGRIDPGGHISPPVADPDAAVGAALQGFEDGLYLVVLDGVEQRDLDRQIYPKDTSTLIFVRLTFLAGA